MDKIEKAVRAAVQGCDPHYCGQAADLLGIEHPDCLDCGGDECDACAERVADAMAAHLIPHPLQWPRFADGEPVRIGDEVAGEAGAAVVNAIKLDKSGWLVFDYERRNVGYIGFDERAKRPEPEDTQERIDADARKSAWCYWRCNSAICNDCPARIDGMTPARRYRTEGCVEAKTLDLLRRQRELCAKDADGYCHRGERR